MFGVIEKQEFHYVYGGSDADGWVVINDAKFGDYVDNFDVDDEVTSDYPGCVVVEFYIENGNLVVDIRVDGANILLDIDSATIIASIIAEATSVASTITATISTEEA